MASDARVTFGYGMVSGQRRLDHPGSGAGTYRDLLDLCAEAERTGFDAVWLSEHHFVDDSYMPSLLPVAAAIAARTTRVRIGTGVALAPFYDPLRLAEDAATVDLISAGRLILGLGIGYREEEFRGLGVPRSEAADRLENVVRVLRGAWSGAPVSAREGLPEVIVTPRPATAAGPPIWLAARQPAGFRRAARLADGFIAARVSPAEFGRQVASVQEAMARQDRAPEQLTAAVHCPVFAWPDGRAWERVRDALHYVEWKYADMVGPAYATRPVATRLPELSAEAEAALRPGALVGTPDEVAERIRAYREVAGPRFHFTARLYWPGMELAVQKEALAVFTERVAPSVLSA